ncbi:PREDICTED: LOW QUALITY PROTEIN: olfactory receptor 6F1-like [Nipponia nippon]|uniref:LOW QUALITY PROTEIN: olfactory receptor 6F1-like n=1 Tax=Nipponia nippon TaxID=128390 RepID=UPI000510A373|nr:PREDICTED: LOW QUALITY PROTEIN: olfactory receptor 6F1-like [Nipponia nippon]
MRFAGLADFVTAVMVLLGSLTWTIISYMYIFSTVLKITSASGIQKVFSTCGAHISVASLYKGSAIFIYMRISQTSLDIKKVVNVLSSVVTPSLNLFIYTLRNEKVKEALIILFTQQYFMKLGVPKQHNSFSHIRYGEPLSSHPDMEEMFI